MKCLFRTASRDGLPWSPFRALPDVAMLPIFPRPPADPGDASPVLLGATPKLGKRSQTGPLNRGTRNANRGNGAPSPRPLPSQGRGRTQAQQAPVAQSLLLEKIRLVPATWAANNGAPARAVQAHRWNVTREDTGCKQPVAPGVPARGWSFA